MPAARFLSQPDEYRSRRGRGGRRVAGRPQQLRHHITSHHKRAHALSGPEGQCDVATLQRWSGILSFHTFLLGQLGNDPFSTARTSPPRPRSQSARRGHRYLGSSKSRTREVPTAGPHAWKEQRTTLHPHQPGLNILALPLQPDLTGRPGHRPHIRGMVYTARCCYTHFRRHKINCSCA